MKRLFRNILCAVLLVGLLVVAPGVGFAAGKYDYGKVDFGGKTVTFVGWCDCLGEFAPGAAKEARLREAEKKFNVKIQMKPLSWDDYVPQLSTRLLSGDSTYDVWLMNHSFFWQMVGKDSFYPLNKVFGDAYYKSLPAGRQSAVNVMSYAGNKYGFGCYGNILGCIRFMGYNKTLLEREGLPDPQKLYEQGKWDWKAFTDIAVKATRDLNGDGKPDQWGTSSLWHWGIMLSNDGRLTREDKNGRRIFTGDEISVTEGLQLYYDLYEKYKVALDDDWGGDQFAAGKVAMQPLECWRFEYVAPKMKDKWGIVPVPKGPRAKDYRYPNLQLESMILPANSKNPKGLVALCDFLWTPEDYQMSMDEGIKKCCPDRKSAEVVRRGVEKWQGEMNDLPLGAVGGQAWSDAINAWAEGKKTAAVAMKEVKPAMQAALDDFFRRK